MAPPPAQISARAFAAAAVLIDDYFMPMAEWIYGDAAATDPERRAATSARWIVSLKGWHCGTPVAKAKSTPSSVLIAGTPATRRTSRGLGRCRVMLRR